MMKSIFTLVMCILVTFTFAQAGDLVGKVLSNNEPIPYATVAIQNSQIGGITDEEGYFELKDIPEGEQILIISTVGFKSYRKIITISSEKNNLGNIQLQEDIFGLEEVVVTGTMKETFVTDSPIKVQVITAKYLERNIAPANIVEGLTLVNGVQEVVACGVCFTNSISINGLDGAYTAVLMDGTPMFGNLASVYGLNGIPTMIIDRFEVIKGPSSTLYGSEAVAGVINIITKDPAEQPFFAADIKGTTHGELYGNFAFVPKIGKYNGYVGLSSAYMNSFDDENEDGFSDIINMDQVSVFTKWSKDRNDDKKTTIAAKYYYEDRRNGVETFLKNRNYRRLRGSDSTYGESIYTNRFELFGTYELPTSEHFKLNYSFSNHLQDSYYGADYYEANQQIAFANFTWNKIIEKHDLLLGITVRFQNYDDNTIATQLDSTTNAPDRQFIPGLFAQDEWQLNERFTLLAGARLDHYKRHGFIFAPRLNAKWKLAQWTTFRANFGTGFRVVNLFTEDHAFVTGQRSVEIQEALNPEQSYNGSLNLNHIYTIGESSGSFDIDAFYTYFINKIVPDYDTPNKIIYANSSGHAISQGIGFNINHQFLFPLALNLSMNLQEVKVIEEENGVTTSSPVEFAPRWSGVGTINYQWKKPEITFAYTLQFTGQMQLPEVYDLNENGTPLPTPRATTSKPFAFQNIQLSKAFQKQNIELYVGAQNLFNHIQQESPLIGLNDPNAAVGFSDFFDTSYAYSPIHGREFYLGIRWKTRK